MSPLYFTTTAIKPVLWDLMEHFDERVLIADVMITEEYMAAAVDALYHDFLPKFFAEQKSSGHLNMLSGNKTLNAIHHFIIKKHTYPINGAIEEFRGKRARNIALQICF